MQRHYQQRGFLATQATGEREFCPYKSFSDIVDKTGRHEKRRASDRLERTRKRLPIFLKRAAEVL